MRAQARLRPKETSPVEIQARDNRRAPVRFWSSRMKGCQGQRIGRADGDAQIAGDAIARPGQPGNQDRKSTRLNSSHANISYAVFCLKKKKSQACCSSRPP